MVRDAIPANWKREGIKVQFHYVLVLLLSDELTHIPKWRDVLLSSNGKDKDKSWSHKSLKQYIMFVAPKKLASPFAD